MKQSTRIAILLATFALTGCGAPEKTASPFSHTGLVRRQGRSGGGEAQQFQTAQEIIGAEIVEEELRFRRVRTTDPETHKRLTRLVRKLRSADISKNLAAEGALESMEREAPVADYVQKVLKHRLIHVRSSAVRLIGKFGSRRHVPVIIDRLEDRDPRVRWNAAMVLRRMTGMRLGYGHRGTRAERAPSIARWRKWHSLSKIIAQLSHEKRGVRANALKKLRRETGQNFGYDPRAPSAERAAAIKQWKNWAKLHVAAQQ